MTLATPWATVVFSLAPAIVPGSDEVLTLGKKTPRERLSVDVSAGLENAALRGRGQNTEISGEEVAVMAMMMKG